MSSTLPLDTLRCLVLPGPNELPFEPGRPQPALPEVIQSLPTSLRTVTPGRYPVARSWLTALRASFTTDAHAVLYLTPHPDWQRFHPRLGPRSLDLLIPQGIPLTFHLLALDLQRTDNLTWGHSRRDDEPLEAQLEWLHRAYGVYLYATPHGARLLAPLQAPLDLDTWRERRDALLDHLRPQVRPFELHAHPWHTPLRLPRVRCTQGGDLHNTTPLFTLEDHRTLAWPPTASAPPTPEAPPTSLPAVRRARERLIALPPPPPHPNTPSPSPAPVEGPHALWAQRLRAMYQSGALSSPRFVAAMCRLTRLETGLDLEGELDLE